jgi:methylenetetrahydrofolate reductase (NADPH)
MQTDKQAGSNLEKVLKAGHFALTAELQPPRGSKIQAVTEKAAHLKEHVDAVNITDNQTAMVRMPSWAACLVLIQEGLEPIFQMVCRDRNRLALQSDVLGAYAHGIRNLLCLSGDHQQLGDHPAAKGVFDIDSMQLIRAVKNMRDEGKFMSGGDIENPPSIFIGAAANPSAEPFNWRVYRLAKKIEAGSDFVQTRCIFDMHKFSQWIQQADDMGLTERVYILAGVTPLQSADMALHINANVPGIEVPQEFIKRLKGASKSKVADEGIMIACEQIQEFKAIKGVAGVHLMTIDGEHRIPQIAEQAKLLPRPSVE